MPNRIVPYLKFLKDAQGRNKIKVEFQPLKKTVENCLKGQYGSNHIVFALPHLGFRKSDEC